MSIEKLYINQTEPLNLCSTIKPPEPVLPMPTVNSRGWQSTVVVVVLLNDVTLAFVVAASVIPFESSLSSSFVEPVPPISGAKAP